MTRSYRSGLGGPWTLAVLALALVACAGAASGQDLRYPPLPLRERPGYEVNGWLLFDAHRALETSPDCIGVCRCAIDWPEWPCIDDSYVITMNRLRGYEVMAERRVRWWLPPGRQTLFLLRRAR